MQQIIEISDANDPRLAEFSGLHGDAGKSARAGKFVVEGRWCAQRLIESDHPVVSILVERGKENSVASWGHDRAPMFSLTGDQIRHLVGYDFHRGVLACGRRPAPRKLESLRLECVQPPSPPLALAAIGVCEHENLGSMIRTATGFGISDLLLGPATADPFYRRTIRVSMATVLKQRIYQLDHPVSQLADLRRRGYRIVATTLDPAAITLDDFQRRRNLLDDQPIILVVGNEANGLEQAIQDVATDRVRIPMQLGIDSLNVSVAAAIFLYELSHRNRRERSGGTDLSP